MFTTQNADSWASEFEHFFSFNGWDGSTVTSEPEEIIDVEYNVIDRKALPPTQWGFDDSFFDKCVVGKGRPYYTYLPEEDQKDFPTRILQDEMLERLIKEPAVEFHVSESVAATSFLAAIGGILGRTFEVNYYKNRYAAANLFPVLVGSSGEGKSNLVNFYFDTISKIDAENSVSFIKKLDDYKQKMKAYAKIVQQNILHGNGNVEPHTRPSCEQYIIGDSTPVSIADSLEASPHGTVLIDDEIDHTFDKLAKNSDLRNIIIHGYDNITYKYNRHKYIQILYKPSLTIYGTIQPELLCEYRNTKIMRQGLFNRFIFINLKDMGPEPQDSPVSSKETKELMVRLTRKLTEIPMIQDGNLFESNKIRASEEAKWFFGEWKRRTAYFRWASVHKGRRAKLDKQIASIALILHVVTALINGTDYMEEVSEDTMAKAIAIGEWIMANQVYVYEKVFNRGLRTGHSNKEVFLRALVKAEKFINQDRGKIATARLIELMAEEIHGFNDNKALSDIAKTLGMTKKTARFASYGGSPKQGYLVPDELMTKAKAAVRMGNENINL